MLNLPNYNCQFINVQRIKNSTTYELNEYYYVKKKIFTQRFGLWNHGLVNVDELPFYSRRINLNGTELSAFVPQVFAKCKVWFQLSE